MNNPFNEEAPFNKPVSRANNEPIHAELQIKTDPIFAMINGRLRQVKGKALRSIVPQDGKVKMGDATLVDIEPTTKKISVGDKDDQNKHITGKMTKAMKTISRVNEDKLISNVRKLLKKQKQKKKYAILPVDLSGKGGIFPEVNEDSTLKSRMEYAREWMKALNELQRPKIEEQARVVATSLHVWWKENLREEE